MNLLRLAGELATSEIESRARTSAPCFRRAWLKPRFSWVKTSCSPVWGLGNRRLKSVPFTTSRVAMLATVPPGSQERKGRKKNAPRSRPATSSRPIPQRRERDIGS